MTISYIDIDILYTEYIEFTVDIVFHIVNQNGLRTHLCLFQLKFLIAVYNEVTCRGCGLCAIHYLFMWIVADAIC